ncbi:Uncharacterized membrane protein [Pseudarcicella hirudinis]|uniref:Uncharacterized membrane protein n=1 Tax=Pseudarcicella hirudinis TaxID=1079859 RepID=A0A1I5RI89_9BACT|nr:DUF1003 domain-containing protein [Pseudarcicella hirudinis]SFP58037.1 Uncharacterized membrane protein [Pseudarcicella hirudinis]
MQATEIIAELSKAQDDQIKKLNTIVTKAINEKDVLADELYQLYEVSDSIGDKVADKVADFGGSWKFIISFTAVLIVWIFINTIGIIKHHFDPYPYILLNLMLSCVAALQAPVIMMSQNRKEEKDRKRAESDYLINLKSEIEVRHLQEKIDLLMTEQLPGMFDLQKAQMELIQKLSERILTKGETDINDPMQKPE